MNRRAFGLLIVIVAGIVWIVETVEGNVTLKRFRKIFWIYCFLAFWYKPLLAQPADFHGWFLSQVGSKPVTQQTLLELAPRLPCVGSHLTPPNAEGERTKIWDPTTLHWTRVGFGEGRWVWIAQADAPPPQITPDELLACGTPAPQPVPIPTVDFSGVIARLDAITAQNERIFADLKNRDAAMADQLKAHDEKPSELGQIFGNKWVQMILAAAGTCASTRCWR